MTNLFSELSPFSNQIVLLLVVIFLKWVVNKTTKLNPFAFFRFYCNALANKVNKIENSPKQQTIAGWLALLITYLTLIIMVWLFEAYIEVVWLWHGFLLFLAIDDLELNSKGRKITKDLHAGRKYQAKEQLNRYLLRDCQPLSAMGVSKAFIEMRILRFHQQLIVPSFLFLLAGPYLSFSFRLLMEMHYCWNTKIKSQQYFGQAVAALVNILQWLPSRILTILILISKPNNLLLHWRLVKKHFFQFNNNFLLHSFALTNEVRLGGVAMYQGDKLRKIAFNEQAKQPEIANIARSNKQIVTLSIGLFLLLTLLLLVNIFLK